MRPNQGFKCNFSCRNWKDIPKNSSCHVPFHGTAEENEEEKLLLPLAGNSDDGITMGAYSGDLLQAVVAAAAVKGQGERRMAG